VAPEEIVTPIKVPVCETGVSIVPAPAIVLSLIVPPVSIRLPLTVIVPTEVRTPSKVALPPTVKVPPTFMLSRVKAPPAATESLVFVVIDSPAPDSV
jgi:hypothetical protein